MQDLKAKRRGAFVLFMGCAIWRHVSLSLSRIQEYLFFVPNTHSLDIFPALLFKTEALLSDSCALYACNNLISGNDVTSLMHITLNNNFTEVGLTETREIYVTEVVLMHAAQLSSCSLVNTAENGDTGSTFKTERSKSLQN